MRWLVLKLVRFFLPNAADYSSRTDGFFLLIPTSVAFPFLKKPSTGVSPRRIKYCVPLDGIGSHWLLRGTASQKEKALRPLNRTASVVRQFGTRVTSASSCESVGPQAVASAASFR